MIIVQFRYSYNEENQEHKVEIDQLTREDANEIEMDMAAETEILLQKFIQACYPEYIPQKVVMPDGG